MKWAAFQKEASLLVFCKFYLSYHEILCYFVFLLLLSLGSIIGASLVDFSLQYYLDFYHPRLLFDVFQE